MNDQITSLQQDSFPPDSDPQLALMPHYNDYSQGPSSGLLPPFILFDDDDGDDDDLGDDDVFDDMDDDFDDDFDDDDDFEDEDEDYEDEDEDYDYEDEVDYDDFDE